MNVKVRNETDPIVIVDDDPADQIFFTKSLERSNLSNPPLIFDGGKPFLSHIGKVRTGEVAMPALVLLDINMPDVTGLEVLEITRAYEDIRPLPIVVMLTSSSYAKDIDSATRLGCDGYQVKPESVEKFKELLDSFSLES